MSLNLGGSYYDNNPVGYSGNMVENRLSNDAGAILYVFKPYPKQFDDVGLRPFGYKFDENFLSETQAITDLAKRGTAQTRSLINDLMSTTNLNDYMVPSSTPTLRMHGSQLSEVWRFILILTEKSSGLVGLNSITTNPSNQARRIYTGFFMDEPYNSTSMFGGQMTLNEHAIMVITHKTVLGLMASSGPFGGRVDISTRSSEEVLNSDAAMGVISSLEASDHGGMYLMTPSNCMNSIETSSEGYSMVTPGAHSDITKDRGSHVIKDVLEQPMHNVAHIVKGMLRYQDDIVQRDRLGTYRVDKHFNDDYLDDGMNRMKLSNFMDLGRSTPSSQFDLDVNAKISPVDIDRMVNNSLQVIPIDNERPEYYETADQMESSITNQYSFLIASVISPILNAAGLNEIVFEYQIAQMGGIEQDDFRVHAASANWPVPDADLRAMIRAVEVELTHGIFKTIYSAVGAFHVAIKADTATQTAVRLNLVGMGYRHAPDFTFPSGLGGLVTPLLGTMSSNSHNSEALENMLGIATGMRTVTKAFNEDDVNYMRGVNSSLGWNETFEDNVREQPSAFDLD